MASHHRDARGRFRASAVPSTSTNLPGGFPDVQTTQNVADSVSDGEVEGVLAETAPQDISHILDPESPIQQAPTVQTSLAHSDSSTVQRQAPPHIPFNPPSPNNPFRATSTPRLPTPLAVPPSFPTPPAPPGIDPVIWAHNQAFIAALIPTLIPALQAHQPAPAPAPAPAPVYIHAPPQPKEGDAKSPTPFSGEDYSKLREFIFECNLIFDVKPRTYATERSRVLYALQYLEGNAKRHFRRFIEAASNDPKVNQWDPFVQELETVFGEPDRLGRASDKIFELKMSENHRVHRFHVQFKEVADELGWPNDVLYRLYYKALPARIKDTWVATGPPRNYPDLVLAAQQADHRHWERVAEKKKEGIPTRVSDGKPQPKTSAPNTPSKSPSNSQSRTPSTPSKSSSYARATTTSAAKAKDLTNILGPDGKLLPEEKARRERLGLCTYCGEDHRGEKCPTKPSGPPPKQGSSSSTPSKTTSSSSNGSKPKGRVAQVAESVVADSDSGDVADADF